MSSTLPRQTGYGVGAPSIKLNPPPIISNRSPTTTDIRYPLMQEWLNKNTKTAYQLVSVEGGVAQWNVSSDDASSFPITPYVVGPSGQAGYQTVQSAINAANAAGGGVVYIQPGTYTENLTLYNNVAIRGLIFDEVTIVGTHTPPTSGSITFQDITLQNTTHIFSSVAAGSTNIFVTYCVINVTNGYLYNLTNWTGLLHVSYSTVAGTNDGWVNNSAGAPIQVISSEVGFGTGNSFAISGSSVEIYDSRIECPGTFAGASSLTVFGSYITNTLTFSGTCTGNFSKCNFVTGSAVCVTMSSSQDISLLNCILDSSANPIITGAGAGTLILSEITYPTNWQIANTVVTGYARQTGFLTPLIVGANGNFGSIQAAINSVKTQFGAHVIYIQGGLYTESLDFTGFTFDCNVHLRSIPLHAQSSIDGVGIIGNITPPTIGNVFFEDINLVATTGNIFTSAAAGTSTIWLRNCNTENVAGGFIFGLANWTSSGLFVLEGHRASGIGTASGIVNNTGNCPLQILNSSYVGTATGSASTVSGTTLIRNSIIYSPITFATGSTIDCAEVTFNAPVTCANNSTGSFIDCNFQTGASAAITMSSSGAIKLAENIINSSANPCIAGAGAGTLTLRGNTFLSNALLANTLTVAYASMDGVLASTNTPGASPQVVNARTGQVKFTDTIANGAYGTLTLTNSIITASSVVIGVASCTTANSALQIVEITPTSGSVAFRIYNAGSATTAANILINFWVLN